VAPTETCPDCAAEIASLCSELLAHAADFADPGDFISIVGTRLNEMGIPVLRIAAGGELLHPTIEARGWRWRPHAGLVATSLERRFDWDSDESWLRSPIYHLVETGGSVLQLSVDSAESDQFPMMSELREEGITEYVLFTAKIGGVLQIAEDNSMYFSIGHGGSFRLDEAAIEALQKLMNILVLILHAATAVTTARTLLGVYLGTDAADKILAGNVVRGNAHPIEAVIWYSDLADFTKITDEMPPQSVLALLNDYASVVSDEVARHGGNVLKFIGDGILAVFPTDGGRDAASQALSTVVAVKAAVAALNVDRAAQGAPTTGVYIALHHGELVYGNFGSNTRMDFTVLGQAVNQAARIAALSRSLDQSVILSQDFTTPP
jgi:adenylate cyclase